MAHLRSDLGLDMAEIDEHLAYYREFREQILGLPHTEGGEDARDPRRLTPSRNKGRPNAAMSSTHLKEAPHETNCFRAGRRCSAGRRGPLRGPGIWTGRWRGRPDLWHHNSARIP